MKNFIRFLTLLVIAIMVMPVMVFAQGELILAGTGLGDYFVSMAAMVPLVTFLTSFLKNALKIDGTWAQIISWIVSIMVAFGGWWLQLGLFADVTIWWHVAIYGVCVGLAANGFFRIEVIRAILQAFKLEPRKKTQ